MVIDFINHQQNANYNHNGNAATHPQKSEPQSRQC